MCPLYVNPDRSGRRNIDSSWGFEAAADWIAPLPVSMHNTGMTLARLSQLYWSAGCTLEDYKVAS